MSSRPTRGAARLAAILDALPDALLLVNSNGTVVDANKAAVEALQAPGTSLVGRGVLDLLPEFDPSRIPGSMRPATTEAEGLDRPVRMTARRTDGGTFPVEVSGNDFTDDGAAAEGRGYVPYDPYREGSGQDLLLLLVRDLSGRLGVEAELRRQHKQTEMILRAAAEGVLGVDLDGRVVLVNPAAAHILDYRASELGGRELHPLVQHSQADGTPLAQEGSALMDTLLSGRKHRVRGAVLWRKDGRPVTVDLTTAPVRDGEQLVGAVMTFTDRTKELALVARNEHLTAVLETELGDALTALHRRIDALAADPAGQLWPEANWTLRRLADECRRFGTLIEGVLAHQAFEADAESGRKQLKRKPVGLDAVVQRAVEHAGELVGPGRVRYSVHAAAVDVTADRERLARALAHLVADVSGITPSLDAPGTGASPTLGVPALPPVGGEAPMVVVAAAQRGEVARIEVRGPARQSSPVHLPIARGTVERHGGVLQRHELPAGAGTTYVVELPLDPAAARAAAGRPSVPKETDTAMLPDLPEVRPAERRENGQAGPVGRGSQEPADHDRSGPVPLGPMAVAPAEQAPERPDRVGEGDTPPAGVPVDAAARPAADGSSDAVPAEESRPSRRRRRAAADETPAGAIALPGVPEPGMPVYPGLENALPAGPPVQAAPPVQPTGRRRRLAVPAEPEPAVADAAPQQQSADALPVPAAAAPATGAELEPVRPAVPEPAVPVPAQPQPVGTGLGELSPPRPLQSAFAAAFPSAFPQPEAAVNGSRSGAPELPALPAPSRDSGTPPGTSLGLRLLRGARGRLPRVAELL
ncbi:PAS domain-containing protein, partial [Kitasatospora sp. NPDC007106]|uniref:PAS domain-containing protein n=1 Tax=Kitasatospora sp. NPDC007106 TaxID=3156914 RepID=UPI0033D3FB30